MARPKNCNRCRKPKRPAAKEFKDAAGYCECGRPTVMTKDTIQKLESAFMNAFSDEQACAYAGISKQALYNYQNANPEFKDRKQALKLRPDMKAKETIVGKLSDPAIAWRWLERRDPDFKPVSKVEHAGTLEIADSAVIISEEEKSALAVLQQARRKRIENSVKEDNTNHENKTEPHQEDQVQ